MKSLIMLAGVLLAAAILAGAATKSGQTESVTVSKNEFRETRKPLSRTGILIGAETRDIRCVDNQIEGFAIPIADLRKG